MGLKDANKVFDDLTNKIEQIDDLTGVLPDLSSDLARKTKKARTFLNKADKASGEKRISHINTASEAIQESTAIMESLGDEAEKMSELAEEVGDLYEEFGDVIFE